MVSVTAESRQTSKTSAPSSPQLVSLSGSRVMASTTVFVFTSRSLHTGTASGGDVIGLPPSLTPSTLSEAVSAPLGSGRPAGITNGSGLLPVAPTTRSVPRSRANRTWVGSRSWRNSSGRMRCDTSDARDTAPSVSSRTGVGFIVRSLVSTPHRLKSSLPR